MTINEFGQRSFVTWTTGLKERLAEKENQMRKYRGLTKEGKWVYGWYCEIIEGKTLIIRDKSILTHPRGFIYDFIEVIPETVGQSTGLRDKKRTEEFPEGQEIYEGDKLKCSMGVTIGERNQRYEEVVVKSGCPCHVFPSGQLYINDVVQAEIIGTIHTHPKLLEQE